MNTQKTFPLRIGNHTLNALVIQQRDKDWVAVRPVCEAVGIMAQRQVQKLQNNPQFSCTLMYATGNDGKKYDMFCIPLEEVSMWLCNISVGRVKPAVRQVLLAFQKFAQLELHAAIYGNAGTERVAQLEAQVQVLSAAVDSLTQSNQALMNELTSTRKTLENLSIAFFAEVEAKNKAQALADKRDHFMTKASARRGSAGSYDMHARKAEIKAKQH